MNRRFTMKQMRAMAMLLLLGSIMCVSAAYAQVYKVSTFVSHPFDDMEEYADSTFTNFGRQDWNSSDLELVRESTGTPNTRQIVGLRFRNVFIPQGAMITRAFIQFAKDNTKNLDPINLVIRIHDTINAPAYDTTFRNIALRPTLNDSVTWSPVSWSSNATVPVHGKGVDERTTNIARLIQRIINRRGWISGNALSFVISGDGTREVESFEGATGDHNRRDLAPELVIEYSLPFTLWNFNGPSSTTVPGGTNAPTTFLGNGTASLIGGTTATFASGTASGGSSDTTLGATNFGWNVSSFPTASASSGTAGAQFVVPTTGYRNIIVRWDQRHSNTSSRWIQFQYSLDGTNYINYTGAGTDSAGLYKATAGDTWFNNRMADLSGIDSANNNPNFRFRLVTVVDPATGAYTAATTTSSFAGTSTLRHDMVSVFGLAIPDYKLQLLHASDLEGGLEATVDAPRFAAVIDTLEHTYPNSLTLSSGDNFIPGPFLSASEDPSLQTPLRQTASSYWGGNSGQIRAAIGRSDIAIMNIIGFQASALGNHEFDLGTSELNSQIGVDIRSSGADKRWIGAQFPYLSANLNFSADVNLNYLFTNQRLNVTQFRTDTGITNNNQKRGLAPSAIAIVNGVKIGIVGATTQVLQTISNPSPTSVVGPTSNDMPALAGILQPLIDSLIIAEGINKIIVLSHLQQLNLEEQLATLLRGVDVIVAGGSHTLLADANDRLRAGDQPIRNYPLLTKGQDGKNTVIVNTDANYRYVGRLVMDFDASGEIIVGYLDPAINGAYSTDSLGVVRTWGNFNNAFAAGTKGERVKVLCDAIRTVIISKDGNIFGKTNVFLEGRRGAVRTQESNLGNITADANLWFARSVDPQVRVSIKNGGGIRSQIGEVFAVGSNVSLLPPQANPAANKQAGDVSQLDIENSLRFNNRLWVVTTTASGLRRLMEHGISATRPGATPGQFPQVAGLKFSYDTTLTAGNKIRNLAIVDSALNILDTIVFNGVLFGDTSRVVKIVTLNFLANPSAPGSQVGGDGYPFPAVTSNVLKLDTLPGQAPGLATFSVPGSEQDAFAEYIRNRFFSTAYNVAETPLNLDNRIQLLNARNDSVFPFVAALSLFNNLLPVNNTSVTISGAPTTLLTIRWQRSTPNVTSPTVTYTWLGDPIGNFVTPALSVPANNNGQDTVLTLTYQAVDSILNAASIPVGGSVTLFWRVRANSGALTRLSTTVFQITITRGVLSVPTDILGSQLQLYPNPASSSLLIDNQFGELKEVKLFNLLGEQVMDMGVKSIGNHTVELNDLADGTYMVRIATDRGVAVRKLIIRK